MADADAIRRFIPPYPPRGEGPVAGWRGFFGERARTAVYGWSERAFREPYLKRKVLGYTVLLYRADPEDPKIELPAGRASNDFDPDETVAEDD